MKKRTQPRQTIALVLGLTAGVLLAACSGPEPTPWVEEQYQEHAADIKKIFGNEVKEDSEQAYIATEASTDKKDEIDLPGWKKKYEITLKTTTEKRKVYGKELPVLILTSKKYPYGINEMHEKVAPERGSLVLGEKTGNKISVTRFIGATQDGKFKGGTLRVKADSSLVLTYKMEGIALPNGRSEYSPPIWGTPNATWEFTLEKREKE